MRELAAKKEKLVRGDSDAVGDRSIRRWTQMSADIKPIGAIKRYERSDPTERHQQRGLGGLRHLSRGDGCGRIQRLHPRDAIPQIHLRCLERPLRGISRQDTAATTSASAAGCKTSVLSCQRAAAFTTSMNGARKPMLASSSISHWRRLKRRTKRSSKACSAI